MSRGRKRKFPDNFEPWFFSDSEDNAVVEDPDDNDRFISDHSSNFADSDDERLLNQYMEGEQDQLVQQHLHAVIHHPHEHVDHAEGRLRGFGAVLGEIDVAHQNHPGDQGHGNQGHGDQGPGDQGHGDPDPLNEHPDGAAMDEAMEGMKFNLLYHYVL